MDRSQTSTDVIFTQVCPRINRGVKLEKQTWEDHVLPEHPQVAGHLGLIQSIIKTSDEQQPIWQKVNNPKKLCITMTAQEIRIHWDREHDILYVLKIGADATKTTNVPVNSDVTLRMNTTKEIVGFIIDDFSTTCPEWKDYSNYHLMEEFDRILNVLNDKCARHLTSQATTATESPLHKSSPSRQDY